MATIPVKAADGSTVSIQVPPAPAARVPFASRSSTTGTTPNGAISVTIYNGGSNDGIVTTALGDFTLRRGESVAWEADTGNTVAQITFNATGTEFVITGFA